MARARLHLTFTENLIEQPILHQLNASFDVVTNIRRANVEEHFGWMIVELEGSERAIADAIAWLASRGVQVDRLEDPLRS